MILQRRWHIAESRGWETDAGVHHSPDLLTNMERLCSVSCADVASRNLGCADVTADDICCADVIYKATGIVLTSMKRLGLSVLTSYKTVGLCSLCWRRTGRSGAGYIGPKYEFA